MGIRIHIYTLYIYPSTKSQKFGIPGKVIAYLRILIVSHYTDSMNKPSCARLKVQISGIYSH